MHTCYCQLYAYKRYMAILKVVINVTIIFRILFNFSSPEVATAYMLSMRAQVTRYLML